MAVKKSKRDARLAAANPLTGQGANTYTQTDRQLPAPTDVRDFTPRSNTSASAESRRFKSAHKEAVSPGGSARPALGYDKPEGMSHRDFGWLAGAHHMFPNDATGPAINEPHPGTPGVTVQRRAEDLTAGEYRKAGAVLSHYGHDGRDPMASLVDTLHHQTNRVIAEHVRAGVEESASQLFYGGPVSTDLEDHPDLDVVHSKGVREAPDTFDRMAGDIARHPRFAGQLAHLPHAERRTAARTVLAQSAADNSPQAKWREPGTGTWPNLEQAKESVDAALEDRVPAFTTGRKGNEIKAANRVEDMVNAKQFDAHQYNDPSISPKTTAFRGAFVDRDNPDAYTVTDIHHASVAMPGLPTGKSRRFNGPEGNVSVYPDEPAGVTKGKAPVFKSEGGKLRPKTGNSRPEQALAVGKPQLHAVIDHAMREVTSNLGLSRSVHHADNVHALQAALWGSQQLRRGDVDTSHADQYPVVRDWGAEGHDTLTDDGRALFGSRAGLGRQYVANPNTTRRSSDGSHDVHKAQPYDVTPRPGR